MKLKDHYFVILCGGTGPRLWPLSRASFPKPFLKLFSRKTLLEETFYRLKTISSKNNIYIVTNKKYQSLVKKTLGNQILPSHIITEPEKRNTAVASLYITSIISQKNPQAIITTLPSDHYLYPTSKFTHCLQKAYQIAKKKHSLVTIGQPASSPNPSYGYLLINQQFQVDQFIEKPDISSAKILIKKNAWWNLGIYTFSVPTIETICQQHQKKLYSFYLELKKSNKNKIISLYQNIDSIAFDYAFSEKTKNFYLVPGNFQWSDIGEWKNLLNIIRQDTITSLSKSPIINQNSSNCLVSLSDHKMLGLVGVKDLAIIDTSDALLVCDLNQSFSVRDLVAKIVSSPKTEKYFLTKNDQK
ncbi:MAG TPA: sugar phosphate nucleotidyltransferase [Candidatus Woesebacteria bacterium]|nr:sugar phosphate nucleotidyltransferase [Candidatus Woesebacteria bacterium]